MRKAQGTYVSGLRFKKESDWTRDNIDDELNYLTTEEFPGQMCLIETISPYKPIRCSELLLGDSRIRLT